MPATTNRPRSGSGEHEPPDTRVYAARRARRRRTADGTSGHGGTGMDRWLLTYSDMITLLLALFVILFAVSTINAKKFSAFEASIARSFHSSAPSHDGLLPNHSTLRTLPTLPTLPIPPAHSDLTRIQAEISQRLAAADLSSVTSVSRSRQGVVVEIFTDKAYFANDSATLQPLGEKVIDTIGAVLRTVPNHVEVQGYIDNVPITGGPYASNWELSGARAAAAVVRLETVDEVTANRLSAVGFGTTHPIASNATAAGRAENRRIDVVVLATTVPAPGATPAPKATVP